MHILVTRPEPDASETKARLEALGHEVSVEPVLRVEPVALDAQVLEGAQAIIATSRNGLRALGASEALALALELPLFTVGPGTAELAREMKFRHVVAGAGTARDLVPLIAAEADPRKGPLVHVAGELIAFDVAAALEQRGFKVLSLIAYRAAPAAALSTPTAQGIVDGNIDAVILMSPRSADIFAQLVADAGIAPAARGLVFICLSQAVADALQRLAPARIEIADAPNAAAMLAAVGRVAT